jgi:hypothetical protein
MLACGSEGMDVLRLAVVLGSAFAADLRFRHQLMVAVAGRARTRGDADAWVDVMNGHDIAIFVLPDVGRRAARAAGFRVVEGALGETCRSPASIHYVRRKRERTEWVVGLRDLRDDRRPWTEARFERQGPCRRDGKWCKSRDGRRVGIARSLHACVTATAHAAAITPGISLIAFKPADLQETTARDDSFVKSGWA